MKQSFCLLLASVFMLFFWATISESGRIYQWKDAEGVTHFADNPMAVPAEYRSKSLRDVKGVQTSGKGDQVALSTALSATGAKLWREKCMECHTAKRQDADGKKSLFSYIIDPVTRFPRERADIVGELEYATSGRTTEMDPVDISEDGLKAIAEYLRDSIH